MLRPLVTALLVAGWWPAPCVPWEVVVSKREDLACANGAYYTDTGPPGATPQIIPGIRSGEPGDESECVVVAESPVAITTVALGYRYVVGFTSHAPAEGPVLSVWATKGPRFDQPTGGQRLYGSPSLPDDGKDQLKYSFDTCTDSDRHDCYSPLVKVDATCRGCTAEQRHISFKFSNHQRNLQLLLPITIRINESWEEEQPGWTFLIAVSSVTVLTVGLLTLVNVKLRGKRGWEALPAVAEVRELGGLVRDGWTFAVARVTGQTTQQQTGRTAAAAAGGGGGDTTLAVASSKQSAATVPLLHAPAGGGSSSIQATVPAAAAAAAAAAKQQQQPRPRRTHQSEAGVSGKRATRVNLDSRLLHHAASLGDATALRSLLVRRYSELSIKYYAHYYCRTTFTVGLTLPVIYLLITKCAYTYCTSVR